MSNQPMPGRGNPLAPIPNGYNRPHAASHSVNTDDSDSDSTPKAEAIPLPPPLIKCSVAGNRSYQDLGVMAPFHTGLSVIIAAQDASQNARSSRKSKPGLKTIPESQEESSSKSHPDISQSQRPVTTLKASRPAPPPPATSRRQATTQHGRGQTQETRTASLGLRLEPQNQEATAQAYRRAEVDELNEMESRMRTLSQGSQNNSFRP